MLGKSSEPDIFLERFSIMDAIFVIICDLEVFILLVDYIILGVYFTKNFKFIGKKLFIISYYLIIYFKLFSILSQEFRKKRSEVRAFLPDSLPTGDVPFLFLILFICISSLSLFYNLSCQWSNNFINLFKGLTFYFIDYFYCIFVLHSVNFWSLLFYLFYFPWFQLADLFLLCWGEYRPFLSSIYALRIENVLLRITLQILMYSILYFGVDHFKTHLA